MSIMRTKGQGLVTISSMPKVSMNSWFSNYYQQKQPQKKFPNIDPIRKLVIQNYNRDLTYAVFYGWDVIQADEMDDVYVFQLIYRTHPELKVHITLGRELQVSDLEHNLFLMYQCYIHNNEGDWSKTIWFDKDDLNYNTFWNTIESIVDEKYPLLPF